jgi:ribosomal protein L19E
MTHYTSLSGYPGGVHGCRSIREAVAGARREGTFQRAPYRELYPDTEAEAERVQTEIYRRMPDWKKIQDE